MESIINNHKKYYNPIIAAFLMAAISGFSDVFCFISLDHLFTAHITGNIVIVIALIISHTQGILPKLLSIPIFILFAAVISVAIETHGINRLSLIMWLIIEIVLLSALLVVGVFYIPKMDSNSLSFLATSMLPIIAMAIHNTLLRTHLDTLPPCTVMTGNLTQFIVDVTNYFLSILSGENERKQIAFISLKKFGNALLGFIFGGLLSTIGFVYLKFYGLIIIILLIVTFIFSLYLNNNNK